MTSPIRLILVPTDFSAHAETALHYAQALAARMDAALHLVFVVEEVSLAMMGAEFYAIDAVTLQAELIGEAERRMQATRLMLEAQHFRVTTSVITGRPAHVIAEHAGDVHADVIVMGSHGRTGMSHALLGSVAERVVRIAPCPVLIVRNWPVRSAADTRTSSAA